MPILVFAHEIKGGNDVAVPMARPAAKKVFAKGSKKTSREKHLRQGGYIADSLGDSNFVFSANPK
jgi:hypothetical protein